MAALTARRPKIVVSLWICFLLASSSGVKAGDPFTIVALPDTQHYCENDTYIQHFDNQTQWVVDNIASENIAFMTHLGDVVQNALSVPQWVRATNALNMLETGGEPANAAYLPYSVTHGNHDGWNEYVTYLGPDRYADESWYGGTSPLSFCHYQTFSAGGYDFLHLNVTFLPNPIALTWSELAWVQEVIDAHPGMPTILSTHSYLTYGGSRTTEGIKIWDKLVNDNSQIFMVLCGHMHYEYQQISVNASGGNVIEMLSDYQDYPEGGMGYLRKIEFDVPNNKINVSTYSPSLDSYQTDANSQFSYYATFGETGITVHTPEPTSLLLLAIGAAVTLTRRRRGATIRGN